jgi:hypothetical protein
MLTVYDDIGQKDDKYDERNNLKKSFQLIKKIFLKIIRST